MKDHISSLLTGIALVLLLFISVPIAHAQTSEGVQIKPGIIEDKVNPGDTYRFSLNVENLAPTIQTFYIETEDISGLDEQGQPIFAAPGQATGYELSSWITVPQESITLNPGETQAISFVAHVPMGAAPGSHFGSVFFTTKPPKSGTNGSAVGIQVGSVISLRISGAITESARLREFSTGKSVYDSPKVDFKVRIEDLGNVLLRPHGLIEISDMFGKKVDTVDVNDSAAPVFPGTDRAYAPVWSYDKFAFGRYEAVLSVVYGDDGRQTISSTTSFWVLPVKLIVTVLGSLFALIIALYILIRIYIRKKLREMGVNPGKQGGADYYEKKYNKSASRMLVVVSIVFLLAVLCLGALFLMFA